MINLFKYVNSSSTQFSTPSISVQKETILSGINEEKYDESPPKRQRHLRTFGAEVELMTKAKQDIDKSLVKNDCSKLPASVNSKKVWINRIFQKVKSAL